MSNSIRYVARELIYRTKTPGPHPMSAANPKEFPEEFAYQFVLGRPLDGYSIGHYRKAAEQDHPVAQYNLGALYYNGDGVPRDIIDAATWFKKSAAFGNSDAQNALGLMYQKGEGVSKDLTQAAEWFKKAAEQNHAEAQFNLASMHYFGDGVPEGSRSCRRLVQTSCRTGTL